MTETINTTDRLPHGPSTWRLPALDVKIRIEETPLGLGVFACGGISSGAELGEIRGALIRGADHQSDYCMDLGEELSLEPAPPYRFVNHCCEPNCELVQLEFEGYDSTERPILSLEAIRDIDAGEELTIDYSWPAEQAIPCGCSASNCRGYIVDSEEVSLANELHGTPGE